MKILVIGDSCEDVFIYGHADRLSPESPAPIFIPTNKKISGGMAKNVFNILNKFKVTVNLITNESKITKTRFVDKKTNYLFLRVDENDSCKRIENLKDIDYKKYDAILISDYNKGYLSCEDIYLISSFHPSCFLDTKKQLGSWCEHVKYIKINRNEYECNKNNIDKNIHKKLIVTLDSDGCIFKNKIYKTEKIKTPDRTGAGDCFIACLVYKYVLSKNILASIKYANSIASKYVSGKF